MTRGTSTDWFNGLRTFINHLNKLCPCSRSIVQALALFQINGINCGTVPGHLFKWPAKPFQINEVAHIVLKVSNVGAQSFRKCGTLHWFGNVSRINWVTWKCTSSHSDDLEIRCESLRWSETVSLYMCVSGNLIDLEMRSESFKWFGNMPRDTKIINKNASGRLSDL